MLKSKIHRAKITEANLYYEGSFTIDQDILEMADMLPYEKVAIVNINNGERFETYAIPGERGSRVFCLNGAAARKGAVGDNVIIISYANFNEDEVKNHKPTVILLGKDNNIVEKSDSIDANNYME